MKIQAILDRQGIIHTDPEIMSGVPVFVGTRVPLQTFFDYLEGESGLAEFLEDFPHLTTQALQVLEAIELFFCFLISCPIASVLFVGIEG